MRSIGDYPSEPHRVGSSGFAGPTSDDERSRELIRLGFVAGHTLLCFSTGPKRRGIMKVERSNAYATSDSGWRGGRAFPTRSIAPPVNW